MLFDVSVAERRLRITPRVVYQGMWLLLAIAACLMMILRRSLPTREGSIWIVGSVVLACLLSFALRDVVRKVGHRNTEDKIVNDVKTFLANETVALPAQPTPPLAESNQAESNQAESSEAPVSAGDGFRPVRPADFMELKNVASYRTLAGDPVVFDAFPWRQLIAFRPELHAVLVPVRPAC